MSSEVEICKLALTMLGEETITALTDETNRGRAMNLTYAPTRDSELYKRRWRFSIKRASLPALAAAPLHGYDVQFQLPVDFLRLIDGGHIAPQASLADYRTGSSALYSIEGDKILTNLGAPLEIRYIARITDTALFHPGFVDVLAARLAWRNCERLTQSDSKRQLAENEYKIAIRESVRAQALEVPPDDPVDDTWVLARTM